MKREPTSVSHQELLSTYRFVRLAMPGLAFLLAVGVTIQIFSPADNCWLGSISAYYYTPARAVFVACLCAIGTCLFVYRGTTEREDLVLNVSGILAFFVALIPTPLEEAETGPKSLCGRSNVPTDTQLSDALANNIWSALAALVMVAIAYAVFGGFLKQGHGRPSTKAVVTSFVVAAVPVVLYVVWPDKVESCGHYVAAVGLFIGVILMTLMHTWPGTFAGERADGSQPVTEPKFQKIYGAVIALMGVVLAVALVMKFALDRDNALFVLESGLIAAFVIFWSVQTWENWGVENEAQADAAQADAAQADAAQAATAD